MPRRAPRRKSVYEHLRHRHEIGDLASVKIEHELGAGHGAVAFADRQPDLRRTVVLDGMPYVRDKLRDLRKYRAVAEHLYLRVGKSHVTKHVIPDLLVKIVFLRAFSLLLFLLFLFFLFFLFFGLFYLSQIFSGFVDIDLVYIRCRRRFLWLQFRSLVFFAIHVLYYSDLDIGVQSAAAKLTSITY